ncbi:MAG: chromate resistance protein [Desulfobacterales bacterium]|nr:chromate resistance protein [Desulfobacterales bacterium]
MIKHRTDKWLLLIHQLPPKPDALRVKIWRRLQQVGAVAVKQSVYAMPFSDETREDLSWILKEITEGGGEGAVIEACFVEGINNDHIRALFRKARKTDYEKLIADAAALQKQWESPKAETFVPQLTRLQKRLREIIALDFFQAPERKTAERMVAALADLSTGKKTDRCSGRGALPELKNKVWVTRNNIFVDRIACGWLIRRFIDKDARFKFVSDPEYTPEINEIRFDMYAGEFTHQGNLCSFEVMTEQLPFQDQALTALAQIVHDIDFKEDKYGRGETDGFRAMLSGLALSQQEDMDRMTDGAAICDALYVYFQRHGD